MVAILSLPVLLLVEALADTETATKHWSRALPIGERPSGRYGHTLNILGSKIFIFGGQVEGYFFNDLVAFDLNALQQHANRWEILIPNSNDSGLPPGSTPPPRTNHTIVTWNNKLFLFGGTDGMRWYNDVWLYDPNTNTWTNQECIGFIPTAREGHAAALVGDVMYVFGGRTEEGKDLGDLAAFRIPTKRWYTFQNMGPSPSPRSGHGLTAVGDKIYVVGGEPSSAPRDPSELSLTYILDTSKIRYPADAQPNGIKPGPRRPSIGDRSNTPSQERNSSSQGQYPNNVSKLSSGNASQDSVSVNDAPPPAYSSNESVTPNNTDKSSSSLTASRSPRGTSTGPQTGLPTGPPPGGPPPSIPQQQAQQASAQQERIVPQIRTNVTGRPPFAGSSGCDSPQLGQRTESPQVDRIIPSVRGPPNARSRPTSPPGSFPHSPARQTPEPINQYTSTPSAPPTQPPTAPLPTTQPPIITQEPSPRVKRQQESVDSTTRDVSISNEDNASFRTPMEQPDRSLSAMGAQAPIDSGVSSAGASPALNHQHDVLLKELENQRTKNAWYASELSMARKAGYRSSATANSPVSEERDRFDEDEKPLVEALVKMRNELMTVQEALMRQQAGAAEQIAQIERQRDAAINEVIYHKTRSAARATKDDALDLNGPGADREQDSARRLAIALSSQAELQSRMHALIAERDAERNARQIAEESAETAHNRATELDAHKQASSSELESLRAQLHEADQIVRQSSAEASEHQASTRSLQVDKNELTGKLATAMKQAKHHDNILSSLREAVTASAEKSVMLEKKLEHERRERSSLEEKLAQLKSEHEARVSELDTVTRRLQDAEDLAASHAAEAQTHRDVVMAGFGKVSDRPIDGTDIQDERVEALQGHLDNAKEIARRNQDAADKASDRLRSAEERIAGLEAYQEQTARENLSMRKQLQLHSREAVALHSEKAELQQQLTSLKMDGTALQVQHSALRDLMIERGLDPNASPARGRSLSGDDMRFRELESQLEAQTKAHEDMRQSFEQREREANRGWEEKLAALDSDYQAAVKYLKGTEKMLAKMKQELHRYKSANKELEDRLHNHSENSSAATTPTPPPAWETERLKLRADLDAMAQRVTASQQDLEQQMAEVRAAHAEREMAQQALASSQKHSESEMASLREHNEMLEKRAEEAERKVQTLLDTVGSSVENFRSSRQMNGLHPEEGNYVKGHSRGLSASSLGAESNYSNTGESTNLNDRNSMALDSLASELETLRTHWETTNKNYRSSQQSVNVTTPITPGGGMTSEGESLANWRRKLDLREREESAGRESVGTA